jgi:uncharacterized caspase-like protein
VFKAQEGKSYSKVEARLLTDATRADVLDGLEWLKEGSVAGDVNLLFLAGHGHTDEGQQFYFMTAEADPDRVKLPGTAISKDEILRTISALKGARIVMLDACRSGAVDMNRLPNELGDETLGVLLYASARGRQVSFEDPKWGNGAFTKAMIEGLGGAADRDKRGYVEADALGIYVRHRVLDLTKEKGVQEPVRGRGGEDTTKIVLLK